MAINDSLPAPSTQVEEARARFNRAKKYNDEARQQAKDDTRFVFGDSDNHWQWPDAMWRSRNVVDSKPCLTINVTAQHCNQILNNMRMNRPQCRIVAVDSGADKKTAEILGGLIRNIQSSSDSDVAHDTAAAHSIYGGEGYWRVITEYENEASFNQIIKIKPIQNPDMVYIDPDCKEMDKSDAMWGMVFGDFTKDEVRRKFGNKVSLESWVTDTDGWVKEDTIRIAEYFWCEYVPDKANLFADGSSKLDSETPDEMRPFIIKTRPTERKVWKHGFLVGGEENVIDEQDWPGSYLPIIAAVGVEINIDGQVIRKGIVRDLKDTARMVNYSYSAAVESISLQTNIPYIAAAEAIEGYENEWAASNTSRAAYLPFNAYDDAGNPIPMPQRQAPPIMPAAQVQMLQLSVEQMRAASGQQNANFGIKSEAASGVGIQRLKQQGEVATFHFPDNQVRALKYEAKVILDLIQKIYDTERVVRILGLDGKDEMALLRPDMESAFQEITADDIQKIFNPTVGLYDVVIDTGPSYQTQRQEAADAMTTIAAKDPEFMHIAGDLYWRSMDVPNSDALAKRYEKLLPPQLQEQKGQQKDIPPEVLDHIQQTDQMVQQMQATTEALMKRNAELEAEYELKMQQNAISAFDAETKRLTATKDAMTPEQVQMIVLQMLQDMANTVAPESMMQEELQEYEQEEHTPEQQEPMQQEMTEQPPAVPYEGQMQ